MTPQTDEKLNCYLRPIFCKYESSLYIIYAMVLPANPSHKDS